MSYDYIGEAMGLGETVEGPVLPDDDYELRFLSRDQFRFMINLIKALLEIEPHWFAEYNTRLLELPLETRKLLAIELLECNINAQFLDAMEHLETFAPFPVRNYKGETHIPPLNNS
jgi:hypothetical protein